MYLAWYGFGRMFIEGLRTDSLYIGAFRISQVVGFLCFAICGSLLAYFLVKSRRRVLDTEEYAPLYERSHSKSRVSAEREQAAREAAPDIDAIIARAEAEQNKESENDNGQAD